MRTITEVRQGTPLSMTFSVDDGSVVLDGIPAGYVQVAVHPEKKMMIVKPCGKKDLGAALAVPSDSVPDRAVIKGSGAFLHRIFDMMRWDHRQNRLMKTTDYLPEAEGWLFDLKDAEMILSETQLKSYTLIKPADFR